MADAEFQCFEVVAIASDVGQFDVEVARLFAERKIFRGVDREGERGRGVGKNRGAGVALVHLAVEDHYPRPSACITNAAMTESSNTQ